MMAGIEQNLNDSRHIDSLILTQGNLIIHEENELHKLQAAIAIHIASLDKLKTILNNALRDCREKYNQYNLMLHEALSKEKNNLRFALHQKIDQLEKNAEQQKSLCDQITGQREELRRQVAEKDKVIEDKEKLVTELREEIEQWKKMTSNKENRRQTPVQQMQQKGRDKSLTEQSEESDDKLTVCPDLITQQAMHPNKETAAEIDRLREEVEQNRQQFDTFKQLAYATRLRQLKEANMSKVIMLHNGNNTTADVDKTVDVAQRHQSEESITLNEQVSLETSPLSSTNTVPRMTKRDTPEVSIRKSENANEAARCTVQKSSLPDHLKRLQEILKLLTAKIEAKKVAVQMYQDNALTIKELESIQFNATPSVAAECLLQVILNNPDPELYYCFLNALKEIKQHHVWSWLTDPGYQMDNEHMLSIINNYTDLVEKLDSRDCGLLGNLFAKEVIDLRDKEDLESELSSPRRNEKLMAMLGRKSKEQFDLFKESLIETGQSHIYAELCGNKYAPGAVETREVDNYFPRTLALRERQSSVIAVDSAITKTTLSVEVNQPLLPQRQAVMQPERDGSFIRLQRKLDKENENSFQEHSQSVNNYCCAVDERAFELTNNYLQGILKLREANSNQRDVVQLTTEEHDRIRKCLESCRLKLLANRELPISSRLYDVIRMMSSLFEETLNEITKHPKRDTVHMNSETCRATKLTHIICGGEAVIGVASLKDELFLLRRSRRRVCIEVYSTDTFELTRTFNVDFIKEDDADVYRLNDAMASCETNYCLYVSHYEENIVYKVDLSADNKPVKWEVGSHPRGLSVNKACDVLVTCLETDTIEKYTPLGRLVDKVILRQSDVRDPWHAIELSNGSYAVCHLGPVKGISVVDREGCVLFAHRNDCRSNPQLLYEPCSLAVTSNDCILVADYRKNIIIISNSSLSDARDLCLSRDDQLKAPSCIYFDESRDRLFVGEYSGRVVILDNVFNGEENNDL